MCVRECVIPEQTWSLCVESGQSSSEAPTAKQPASWAQRGGPFPGVLPGMQSYGTTGARKGHPQRW